MVKSVHSEAWRSYLKSFKASLRGATKCQMVGKVPGMQRERPLGIQLVILVCFYEASFACFVLILISLFHTDIQYSIEGTYFD